MTPPRSFTAKIQYKPSAGDDPIPWSVHVYCDGEWVDHRWRGTRQEALEAVREMKAAYLARGLDELIQL